MQSLVVYNHPSRDSSSKNDSGGGGGHVEDILKRLGNVETDVSELKSKVSVILTTVPHLATKTDVMDVRSAVAELRTEMAAQAGSLRAEMATLAGSLRTEIAAQSGSLRTEIVTLSGSLRTEIVTLSGSLRTEIAALSGSLTAEMAARETAFIKWMIATVLAAAGLAFTIAKFVH